MKISTSELTHRALDWAVAVAEGQSPTYVYHPKGGSRIYINQGMRELGYDFNATDWAQGGPIIEREGIGFHRNGKRTFANENMRYEANVIRNQDDAPLCRVGFRGCGPTPLIAAMRCYVAQELGDEVDIPEELL